MVGVCEADDGKKDCKKDEAMTEEPMARGHVAENIRCVESG